MKTCTSMYVCVVIYAYVCLFYVEFVLCRVYSMISANTTFCKYITYLYLYMKHCLWPYLTLSKSSCTYVPSQVVLMYNDGWLLWTSSFLFQTVSLKRFTLVVDLQILDSLSTKSVILTKNLILLHVVGQGQKQILYYTHTRVHLKPGYEFK